LVPKKGFQQVSVSLYPTSVLGIIVTDINWWFS